MNRLSQNGRSKVGYTYRPMINNNIGIQQVPSHNYSGSAMGMLPRRPFGDDLSGEGVMDLARSLYDKGKSAASYLYDNREALTAGAERAVNIYGGPVGTAVKNILPASDENARPQYVGERHAILKLPNGKYGVANFMGPATQIVKRLKRGDPPRTEGDKVAQRHDIDYALAAGLENKEAQAKAVRVADKNMVSSLDRIARRKGDAPQNLMIARRLIQGKMAAEDVGLLKTDKFAGDLQKISRPDKILLMAKATELEQAGYGMLPGEALRMKLLKQELTATNPRKTDRKNQAGGFWFLAPLIALAAEAISGITVASVGSAVATGAIGAAAGVATKKILGSGKQMHGKGVKEVAQKVAGALKKSRQRLIEVARTTGVDIKDLPKHVLEKAQQALDMINAMGKPTKEGILKVVKQLIPHIKAVYHSKMKSRMGGAGLTLAGAGRSFAGAGGDFDSKVLSAVSKAL